MSDAPESVEENQAKTPLDNSQVVAFLENNTRFFEENQELLGALDIPHESGGSVSLIERQVVALRNENTQLKRQLSTLINHAHDNDNLFAKTKALTLDIIRAQDYTQLRECIEKAMVDEFNATVCRLWWLGADNDSSPALEAQDVNDKLGRLVAQTDVFCGLLKEDESELLFGEQANQVGSAAVLMLHDDEKLIAALAIANEDRDYYRDSMSTSMLSYIGEVVVEAIVLRTA